MKLLTLNTHSLAEDNYKSKLETFITAVTHETPDVMALQEVNQRQDHGVVIPEEQMGYIPCFPGVVLRDGNHALAIARGLWAQGIYYHWTWLPVKRGYGIYDEGVALFSRAPILDIEHLYISKSHDYNNWKTRRLLGIRVGELLFYSVHLGWWDDPDEPFTTQWRKVSEHMQSKGQAFLMGDFNSPAEMRGEGYDLMRKDGWLDTFLLAGKKDSGITVSGRIAGWTHRNLPAEGARVDHILCHFPCRVLSSKVIFNGEREAVVSDHFGVMVELEEK
ncbi:MAG: exodeoxyribonuclease III [Ruminococcaceae bacterium]|nr:exodeoxyribonuclease III [Oscillospiraceae bacterium]